MQTSEYDDLGKFELDESHVFADDEIQEACQIVIKTMLGDTQFSMMQASVNLRHAVKRVANELISEHTPGEADDRYCEEMDRRAA